MRPLPDRASVGIDGGAAGGGDLVLLSSGGRLRPPPLSRIAFYFPSPPLASAGDAASSREGVGGDRPGGGSGTPRAREDGSGLHASDRARGRPHPRRSRKGCRVIPSRWGARAEAVDQ